MAFCIWHTEAFYIIDYDLRNRRKDNLVINGYKFKSSKEHIIPCFYSADIYGVKRFQMKVVILKINISFVEFTTLNSSWAL